MIIVESICAGLLLLLLAFSLFEFFYSRRMASSETAIPMLDQYTTDCYLKQLQNMVMIYSIYKIESLTGQNFTDQNGIATVENADLVTAAEEIQTEVYTDMSDQMKYVLFTAFGEEYIRKYIRGYTLSFMINYSEHTIKEITQALK